MNASKCVVYEDGERAEGGAVEFLDPDDDGFDERRLRVSVDLTSDCVMLDEIGQGVLYHENIGQGKFGYLHLSESSLLFHSPSKGYFVPVKHKGRSWMPDGCPD